jgi:hypothetical protein
LGLHTLAAVERSEAGTGVSGLLAPNVVASGRFGVVVAATWLLEVSLGTFGAPALPGLPSRLGGVLSLGLRRGWFL